MTSDHSAAHDARLGILRKLYPEHAAGGFTHRDSSVIFFTRVNALLPPDAEVLDFGAGRARWSDPDVPKAHLELRDFRLRARRVVGVDVDPVVLENPTLHAAHHISPGERLPLADDSFDLVLADFVFEHIDGQDAPVIVEEFSRIVRPGGWVTARTPNKWGVIGIGARLVPNALHTSVLSRLTPWRAEKDVFPTRYTMNTKRDLRRLFPSSDWNLYVHTHASEPSYAGNWPIMWRIMGFIDRLTPPAFEPTLMIFAERK